MPLSIHPLVLLVALRLPFLAEAAVFLVTSAKSQVVLWGTGHSLA